ncbi:glycosyltransferase family 2 protein [Kaistia terrae]|uniref:Glycosyltransferase family 2 protein n=1 Tax=Kaistia terrae TaxID=537017 RepID=A0ABW0Q162_9HYPH|nr:glycosyltransferase family 2 protein [Kaistia terrae]MCX5578965.1 glycosyltransferase family 2 protein [Kaistia terrae]
MKSVSVVVVAYNSAHIIAGALSELDGVREIICIDNASSDDLSMALSGIRAKIVRNEANIGFGRACNQGSAVASGEFVLFINPDVRVNGETLPRLLEAVRRYPDCGVFLPMTRRSDGGLWIKNAPAGHVSRGRNREVIGQVGGDFCSQFLDGSIFLIRRSLFTDFGGFDRNIFLYYEDDDLSRRLGAARSPIIIVKDSFAMHGAGESVSGGVSKEIYRNKHKKISEIYYNRKYGIEYNIVFDVFRHLFKAVFYAVVFDKRRLMSSLGRILGLFSHMTSRT